MTNLQYRDVVNLDHPEPAVRYCYRENLRRALSFKFDRVPPSCHPAMQRLYEAAHAGHSSRADQLAAIGQVMRDEGFAAPPDWRDDDGRPYWRSASNAPRSFGGVR